jgi:hypothetical protein
MVCTSRRLTSTSRARAAAVTGWRLRRKTWSNSISRPTRDIAEVIDAGLWGAQSGKRKGRIDRSRENPIETNRAEAADVSAESAVGAQERFDLSDYYKCHSNYYWLQ